MNCVFRRAAAADLDGFMKLIDDRIAWMDQAGIRQWNATNYKKAYPREYYERAALNGDLWALTGEDGRLLAAACLFDEDRRWDDGVPALYVHNFASVLDVKDAGREFLRQAAAMAVQNGKERMRLDSADDNVALGRYYESQGYRAVGTVRDGLYHGILREKLDLPGFPLRVNVLLFDGFETLDAMGPLDILARLPEADVRCVSLAGGSVTSAQGVRVHTEALNARDSGVLLVPGGMGTRTLVNEADFLAALRKAADSNTYVLSVCTGSALLARCGALDSRKATSNKRAFAWAASCGERVLWQPKARWTVDGKFCTSSGVAAGLDMALGFAADRFGREKADEIARTIEYVRNSDPDCDSFAVEDPA